MASLPLLSAASLLFVFFFFCSFQKPHALSRREYHTVQLTSLLPDTVCNPSTPKGVSNRKPSLQVVHSHGPCSHISHNPTLAQILSHDQARVDSIKARLTLNSRDNIPINKLKDRKTILPAQPGLSLGSGNYFVTIGLGTPPKQLSLIFDTGSDITWTQCEPCVKSCYTQKQEIFNPTKSSSYSNITCNSPLCSSLKSATGVNPGCSSSTCVYGIQYGDQSFSVGFYAEEKLTLTPSGDVLDNIPFGCGQNNQGLFGTTAGLIGLGRHPLSIVTQTAPKYGKIFSYCLPTTANSGGHLTFGSTGLPKNVKYTPFSNSGDVFYVITITGISVGGRLLPINASVLKSAGTIIDSGTVITRLPPLVYGPLRDAFKQQMTQYKLAKAFSILDACYDLTGYTSIKIPTISFFFSGNVKVDIIPKGILIVANGAAQVCLAFAEDNSALIFGNLQQQTWEVVHDVAGGKIGFAPGGCA